MESDFLWNQKNTLSLRQVKLNTPAYKYDVEPLVLVTPQKSLPTSQKTTLRKANRSCICLWSHLVCNVANE